MTKPPPGGTAGARKLTREKVRLLIGGTRIAGPSRASAGSEYPTDGTSGSEAILA